MPLTNTLTGKAKKRREEKMGERKGNGKAMFSSAHNILVITKEKEEQLEEIRGRRGPKFLQ